ncbi:CRAL TRIO domain-containing protein [Suillus bovinus]|uniref:CRAL TRIO domain-containing protein n=1 Tax=Suillus bovinus TaxID=48563 RepID=UPI001B86A9FE|nr:CRAL TRIO domain-containing protein [Suillus bovinus]KAG2153587.1 CRAL TRIO domain-containing protein [Suillus bovinus]
MVKAVFTAPVPGTVVHPIHQYSDEQQTHIKALREYADTLLLDPSDPYYKWELRWLNKPDTMPRYMRAAKWKLPDAKRRIEGTIKWRREFRPELIRPDDVKIEAETGKILLNGFDKDGRPIIYMRPGRENTETSPRQLRHLVWWLERAKDMMPPGQESLVIIVDYRSTTLRTNPSISVASKVLTILQQHYVETLGRAIVTNLPMLLNFFYKGISPFLDPVTRDKMRFNPDLLDLIPKSQLDSEFGGDFEFEFDHETYWKQIVDFCGIAEDGTRLEGYFDGPKDIHGKLLSEHSDADIEPSTASPTSNSSTTASVISAGETKALASPDATPASPELIEAL